MTRQIPCTACPDKHELLLISLHMASQPRQSLKLSERRRKGPISASEVPDYSIIFIKCTYVDKGLFLHLSLPG